MNFVEQTKAQSMNLILNFGGGGRLCFEVRSHYITLVGPELSMWTRLALNLW